MLALLKTKRWISFTLLVVVMIGLCFLGSRWQWDRGVNRRAANDIVEANLKAPAAPVDQVMSTSEPVTSANLWRTVTAVGRYLPEAEAVIRKRPRERTNGYWIVTPLQTATGILLVNRGWVAAPGDARANPSRPQPPAGEVTVTGRVRADEGDAGDREGLPDSQFMKVDVNAISAQLAVPGTAGQHYTGYVELVSSTPAGEQGLALMDEPEVSDGPHVAYSIQWAIFALIGVIGWFRLLRKESADTGTHQAQARTESPSP